MNRFSRRTFLSHSAAAAGWAAAPAALVRAQAARMARRPIPRTGEPLPVIGLGTSDEFERVPADGEGRLKSVIDTLVAHGGTVVDTAPGYGDSEALLGRWLAEMGLKREVFLCSKVSTFGEQRGRESLARTQALLGKEPLDLLQVHSLRDVHTQLENLAAWKEAGRVRYIGITTHRGMGYDVVEELIASGRIDFVQVDYSVVQPSAERRVIPAAADHGVAVMINSAFGNGRYFSALRGHDLPEWAGEFDCESWAQFSLKYILGEPGVTCALAATSDPRHMADNARAGHGALPDRAMRRRMAAHIQRILG